MRQSLLSFCFGLYVFFSPFLLSCAEAQREHGRSATKDVVVRLWVAPDPVIPKKAIFDGCRYWEPLGVRCVEVSLPEHANVRVRYSRETCLSSAAQRKKASDAGNPFSDPLPLTPECRDRAKHAPSEDNVIVGVCHPNGDIEIFVPCLKKTWPDIVRADGTYDPAHIVFIAAHEIGHALGLDHVPSACDDRCVVYARDAAGVPVCGDAVMNPQVSEPKTLASPDRRAFMLRDVNRP